MGPSMERGGFAGMDHGTRDKGQGTYSGVRAHATDDAAAIESQRRAPMVRIGNAHRTGQQKTLLSSTVA